MRKREDNLVTISDEKENEFVNGMRCRNLSTDYQQSIWLGGSDTANEEHGLGLQVNRLHTVTGNQTSLMVEPRRIIFRCIHQVTGMMCRMKLADLCYVNMIRYNQS